MSTLTRYLDSKFGCWARVDLDSGEPVWISVAQNGIVIKKSRLGLLGPTLFHEREVIGAANIARLLDSQIQKYLTPQDMTNPVLRVFTQVALESSSAASLGVRLSEARNAAFSAPATNPSTTIPGRSQRALTSDERSAVKEILSLVQSYGAAVQAASATKSVVTDASRLPAPKERIKAALLAALRLTDDAKTREQLKVGYLELATFQPGVGNSPITYGIPAKLPDDDDSEAIVALARSMSETLPAVEKWTAVVAEEQRRLSDELKKAGFCS